jgi:hypothetical protein
MSRRSHRRGHSAGSNAAQAGSRSLLLPWLALAALVIVLDLITKHLVLRHFKLGERLEVFPGWLDLTLVYNTGAAFSFLANAGGWQRWFFVAIGVLAAGFIFWVAPSAISLTACSGARSSTLCWCTGKSAGFSRPSTWPIRPSRWGPSC